LPRDFTSTINPPSQRQPAEHHSDNQLAFAANISNNVALCLAAAFTPGSARSAWEGLRLRDFTSTVNSASQHERAQRRSENQVAFAADVSILLALRLAAAFTSGSARSAREGWRGLLRDFTSTINPPSQRQATRRHRDNQLTFTADIFSNLAL